MKAYLRLLAACASYAGYWFRPYDMLADRRRWFWQPRQRCFYLMLPDPTPEEDDD